MKIGLNEAEVMVTSLPSPLAPSRPVKVWVAIWLIIRSVTSSLARAQMSTTLLYFSPEVIRPSWY